MQKLNHHNDLIVSLFKIGAIQSGEFLGANGTMSPLYVDLRRIVSFPDIYQYVVDLFAQTMIHKKFHHIGGVPYAALPLASGIALLYQKPMIMIRKADHQRAKAKPIEGIFKKGDKVILVEDVVASGASIEQTIDILTAAGLTVVETVVLLDRQQGARKRLAVKGIKLTTLCTLSQALSILHQQGHLDRTAIAAIDDFIQEHQF